jgi:hypothetical protein
MGDAMTTWFSKELGDGLLAFAPKEAIHLAFAAHEGSADRAVFTRHELEGRLQCEVMAYFSPAAKDLAQAMGAQPCERPLPHDLDLLAGSPKAWDTLFPDR